MVTHKDARRANTRANDISRDSTWLLRDTYLGSPRKGLRDGLCENWRLTEGPLPALQACAKEDEPNVGARLNRHAYAKRTGVAWTYC